MNRRGILAALPMAGAALVLPAPADAAPGGDTPMIAAYREWRAAYDRIGETQGDNAYEEACNRLDPIEERMATLPFWNAMDVLAFLAATTRWGDLDRSWRYDMPAQGLALVEAALGPELLKT
ncbi:hypothetical protein [Paracoccus sp. SY]|uniref:hypothetical protein n=1 Tax=Paracoccus sp. SY TaxID=1330255 RepID=UPI000CD199C6|nr:hypothetical protein [Paracoccus sp. SY]